MKTTIAIALVLASIALLGVAAYQARRYKSATS
jgi:Tfp pilus assembly protein PilV